MTIEPAELGLRERKRLATRRSIQLAAITLVAEKGLDRLTVDEIGRVADISPRTFFNYFPTKEAALIGDTPTLPDEDVVATFIEGGANEDLLSGLERLFADAIERAAEDRELSKLRRRVMKQYPHLFAMRILTMHDFQSDVQTAIAKRLRYENSNLDDADLDNRAGLIMQVSVATMRHAWHLWSTDGDESDLTLRLHNSFVLLRGLLASPTHK